MKAKILIVEDQEANRTAGFRDYLTQYEIKLLRQSKKEIGEVARKRFLRFISTHNDKIIGISDHLKTRRLHRRIDGMEVEVGQQGTDHCSFGC